MPIVADLSPELSLRLLSEPPAIVRPIKEIGEPDAVEKHRRWVAEREIRANAWISRGAKARELVWQAGPKINWEGVDKQDLDDWIARIDGNIELNTQDYIKTQRHMKREFSSMKGKVDARKLSEFRNVIDRGLAVWSREIEEIIDFSVFLRAFRAEFAPTTRPSRTFNSIGSLKAHLAAGD